MGIKTVSLTWDDLVTLYRPQRLEQCSAHSKRLTNTNTIIIIIIVIIIIICPPPRKSKTCQFGYLIVYFLPISDEVIRKRLLIDGDGAGDDRRINLLVKSFIKWCNAGSQEEGYSQYQRMLSTLSQCEFSMGKTLLVYDMNLREMENYEKIYKDIENNIAGAHEKIAECKKQILQAKRIRKNRQEYDALAKVIQYHPDRHETLKELDALGKELQHLSHIKESVEDKLELRRKQFHVLLSTIHELQQTLESKWWSG
uniref:THO complex subunit 7 n=1 Tax=Ornithorhynchus anatinus TaxID=9258 RepID=A0A6I8NP69_ORNAN